MKAPSSEFGPPFHILALDVSSTLRMLKLSVSGGDDTFTCQAYAPLNVTSTEAFRFDLQSGGIFQFCFPIRYFLYLS
jgi:hypothetical protein